MVVIRRIFVTTLESAGDKDLQQCTHHTRKPHLPLKGAAFFFPMGYAMLQNDQLRWWIDGLRVRLSTGHLADIPPIDLGDGTWRLQGATMIHTMLADLDDLNNPQGSASDDPEWRQARLWFLRDAFRRLRERIG
jgi:hypothetical protein